MEKPTEQIPESERPKEMETAQTLPEAKQTAVISNVAVLKKSPSSLELELGVKQIGPYKITQVLGFGAMGTVYEAEDTKLNRKVAVKVLNKKWLSDEVAKERFVREAKLSSLIKSKHVAIIHDVGEENGVPYLAMELLEGFPLEKLIQQKVRLTVSQIIRLGREIARGLAAAHEKGLVHRDIKPANIWLEIVSDDPGSDKKLYRVKILDFGMARLQEQTQGLTRHGIVVGTPLYMSPEQASGSKIDGRSDLFSLGVVLYELCTGRLPFQGETAVGVMSALASENPPPVREVNPEIPKKLSRIIDRLLAKLPDDRPPNALNVARLLDGLERGDSGETVADSSLRDAAAPAEGKAAEGSGPVPSLDSTASLPVRLQLPNLFPYLVASVVLNVVCLIVIAYLVGKLF